MKNDDPETGDFASWDSYQRFAHRVRHERRFVWTDKEQAFLSTVRATIKNRDIEIAAGSIFYRAQQGIDWHMRVDDNDNEMGEEPVGFSSQRMKPRRYQTTEGRVNPAGLPVLYLGTTIEGVISEARPWIGASLSVAQLEIVRSLKAIDLSRGHGKSSFSAAGFRQIVNSTILTKAEKREAVWIDIDSAFSRPVSLSDDAADYVPTQILAELFRDEGYDAIVYKSQFGERGYNVALFNLDDAEVINCGPYEVTALKVEYKELGNKWSRAKPSEQNC